MRVAVLTADEIRHRYFANRLRAAAEVVAVVYQETGYRPASVVDGSGADARTAAVVRRYFQDRTAAEQLYFGAGAERTIHSAACAVCTATPESLNTTETAALLQAQDVDTVVVYGTTLITGPLLEVFRSRIINMHLGLSPYYRGTATNFYPLLNDEPEYVGATIHLIDAGIDSGPIIHHARPQVSADDTPHSLGCRAILAGIEKMIQTLAEMAGGRLRTIPQWPTNRARLYLRRDYRPSQVVQLYEMIEAGLFPRYVARKAHVENAMRLVP